MEDQPSDSRQINRREFLKQAGMMSAAGLLPGIHIKSALRPPGASPDFLSKCIRCGKCAESCPYDSIRFLGLRAGLDMYTPYIDPLKMPCFLCQEKGPDGKNRPISRFLRCGEACPTGALLPIENKTEVLVRVAEELKIGTAELNRSSCLAWQFNFCSECYFNCPLKDKALLPRPPGEAVVGSGIKPYVDQGACIGCGRCVYVCPVRRSFVEPPEDRDMSEPDYVRERYGALVQRLLDQNGNKAALPAIRVKRK